MTRLLIALLTIFASLQSAYPQESPAAGRTTRVAIEFGYYSPARESFRKNYDQCFFLGSSGVPIALGVEIDYPLSAHTDLFLSVSRINHQLKSHKAFTLALMPATMGIHYYIPKRFIDLTGWTPFLGTGLEFWWTRFSATYLVTQNDPTPLLEVNSTESYLGYGITFGLGIEHPLGDIFSSSFGVNYDVSRLGSADEGGLGNLGGFLFAARLTVNL